MIQTGKYISGEFYSINSFTKDWTQVEIDIEPYNERYIKVIDIAQASEGNFTDLYDDRRTCIRFELESDAEKFKDQYEEF